MIINADNFEYNKTQNILKAFGNVKVIDSIENFTIFSNKLIYLKTMKSSYLSQGQEPKIMMEKKSLQINLSMKKIKIS